jgi:hypothetical protein
VRVERSSVIRVSVVDERDVSIELPFPVFRVTVWRREGTESVTFDIEDAAVSDVLDFARSPEHGDADMIEVFCKIDVGNLNAEDETHGTVLLERITR